MPLHLKLRNKRRTTIIMSEAQISYVVPHHLHKQFTEAVGYREKYVVVNELNTFVLDENDLDPKANLWSIKFEKGLGKISVGTETFEYAHSWEDFLLDYNKLSAIIYDKALNSFCYRRLKKLQYDYELFRLVPENQCLEEVVGHGCDFSTVAKI
eukprot:UN30223